MPSPFDFFDRLYCIHLPREGERESRVRVEFGRLGIADRVEFVAAAEPAEGLKLPRFGVHGKSGHRARGGVGCTSSHLKALAHALHAHARNALIFEDDVTFGERASTDLALTLESLPSDWEVLYLGGRPHGHLGWVAEGVARTWGMSCTHAYALNGPTILPAFDRLLDRLTHHATDHTLAEFAGERASYCAVPPICHQRPGVSAIEGKMTDYTSLFEDAWKRFAPVRPT